MPKFFAKTRMRAPRASGERLSRLFGFSASKAPSRRGSRLRERIPRAAVRAKDNVLDDEMFRFIISDPELKHLYFDVTPDAIAWRKANYKEINAQFRELNPDADKIEKAVRASIEHEVRNAYRQYRRSAKDPKAYSDERMEKDIEEILKNTDISYTFFSKEGYPQVFVDNGGKYESVPDFSSEGWEGLVSVHSGINGFNGPTVYANAITSPTSLRATVAHEADHAVEQRNPVGTARAISDDQTASALDLFKEAKGMARNGRNAHRSSYNDQEIMATFEEARLVLDHYFPNGIPDEAILSVRVNPDGGVDYSSVFDVLRRYGVSSGYVRDDYVPDLEAAISNVKDDPTKLGGFVSGWRKMFRTLYNNLPALGAVAVGAGALAGLMGKGGHFALWQKYSRQSVESR